MHIPSSDTIDIEVLTFADAMVSTNESYNKDRWLYVPDFYSEYRYILADDLDEGQIALRNEIMDVDMIFKIAAIGIIVAILNQLLVRSGREEQALLTTIAGLVVALMMIISQISELFSTVKSTFGL